MSKNDKKAASGAISSPPPMVIFDERRQGSRLLSPSPFGDCLDADEQLDDGMGAVTIAEAVSEAVVGEMCHASLQIARAATATSFDQKRMEFILDENEQIVDFSYVKDGNRISDVEIDGVVRSFSSGGPSLNRSYGEDLTDSGTNEDRESLEDSLYFDTSFQEGNNVMEFGRAIDTMEYYARNISGLTYLSDIGVEDSWDDQDVDIEKKVIAEYGMDYIEKYEKKHGGNDEPNSSIVESFSSESLNHTGHSLAKEQSFQSTNTTATTAEILDDIINAEREGREIERDANRTALDRQSLRRLIQAEHQRQKNRHAVAKKSMSDESIGEYEGKEVNYSATKKALTGRSFRQNINKSLESIRRAKLIRLVRKNRNAAKTRIDKANDPVETEDARLSNCVKAMTPKPDNTLATEPADVTRAANLILDDTDHDEDLIDKGSYRSVDLSGAMSVAANHCSDRRFKSSIHATSEKLSSNYEYADTDAPNLILDENWNKDYEMNTEGSPSVDLVEALATYEICGSVRSSKSNTRVASEKTSYAYADTDASNLILDDNCNLEHDANAGGSHSDNRGETISAAKNHSSFSSLKSNTNATSEKTKSTYSYGDRDAVILDRIASDYSFVDTDKASTERDYSQRKEKLMTLLGTTSPDTEYSRDQEIILDPNILVSNLVDVDPSICGVQFDESVTHSDKDFPLAENWKPSKHSEMDDVEDGERKNDNLEVIHDPRGPLVQLQIPLHHENSSSIRSTKPMDSLSDCYDNEEVVYDPSRMKTHTSCCDPRSIKSSLETRNQHSHRKQNYSSESDLNDAIVRRCLWKIIDESDNYQHPEGVETELNADELKAAVSLKRRTFEKMVNYYSSHKIQNQNSFCDPRSIAALCRTPSDPNDRLRIEQPDLELDLNNTSEGVERELNADELKTAIPLKQRGIERMVDYYSTLDLKKLNSCCDPRSIAAVRHTQSDRNNKQKIERLISDSDLNDVHVRSCLWKIIDDTEYQHSNDADHFISEGVETELNVDEFKKAKPNGIGMQSIRATSRSIKHRLLDPERLFCGLRPIPQQRMQIGNSSVPEKNALKQAKQLLLKNERMLHPQAKLRDDFTYTGTDAVNDFQEEELLKKESANNLSMETATTAATEDEAETSHFEIEVTDLSTVASNDRLITVLLEEDETPLRKGKKLPKGNIRRRISTSRGSLAKKKPDKMDDNAATSFMEETRIPLMEKTRISVTTHDDEIEPDRPTHNFEKIEKKETIPCPGHNLPEDQPDSSNDLSERPAPEFQERQSQYNGELEDLLRRISSYVDGIVEKTNHSMSPLTAPSFHIPTGQKDEKENEDGNSDLKKSSLVQRKNGIVETKNDALYSKDSMIDTIYIPSQKTPEKAENCATTPDGNKKSVKTIDIASLFDGSFSYSECSQSKDETESKSPQSNPSRSLIDDEYSEISSLNVGSSFEPEPRPHTPIAPSQPPQDVCKTSPVIYKMKSPPLNTKRTTERRLPRLKKGVKGRSTSVRQTRLTDDDDDIELLATLPYRPFLQARPMKKGSPASTPPSRRNFLSERDGDDTRSRPVFHEEETKSPEPQPPVKRENPRSYREECRPPTPPRKVRSDPTSRIEVSLTTTNGRMTKDSPSLGKDDKEKKNAIPKSNELVLDNNGFLLDKNVAVLEDLKSTGDATTFHPYQPISKPAMRDEDPLFLVQRPAAKAASSSTTASPNPTNGTGSRRSIPSPPVTSGSGGGPQWAPIDTAGSTFVETEPDRKSPDQSLESRNEATHSRVHRQRTL